MFILHRRRAATYRHLSPLFYNPSTPPLVDALAEGLGPPLVAFHLHDAKVPPPPAPGGRHFLIPLGREPTLLLDLGRARLPPPQQHFDARLFGDASLCLRPPRRAPPSHGADRDLSHLRILAKSVGQDCHRFWVALLRNIIAIMVHTVITAAQAHRTKYS